MEGPPPVRLAPARATRGQRRGAQREGGTAHGAGAHSGRNSGEALSRREEDKLWRQAALRIAGDDMALYNMT